MTRHRKVRPRFLFTVTMAVLLYSGVITPSYAETELAECIAWMQEEVVIGQGQRGLEAGYQIYACSILVRDRQVGRIRNIIRETNELIIQDTGGMLGEVDRILRNHALCSYEKAWGPVPDDLTSVCELYAEGANRFFWQFILTAPGFEWPEPQRASSNLERHILDFYEMYINPDGPFSPLESGEGVEGPNQDPIDIPNGRPPRCFTQICGDPGPGGH